MGFDLSLWEALEKVLIEGAVVKGEAFMECDTIERLYNKVYHVRKYSGSEISQPLTISLDLFKQKYRVL
jgi:hypothetical protein